MRRFWNQHWIDIVTGVGIFELALVLTLDYPWIMAGLGAVTLVIWAYVRLRFIPRMVASAVADELLGISHTTDYPGLR